MGSESPAAVLFDMSGNELPVQNGAAIPANTPLLLIGGSDGTNSRYIAVDSSGRQILVGAGTAGTPAGGVLTIQGSSSGTAVPISGSVTISSGTITVSGTITANQGTPNTLANGWPVELTDGTNLLGTSSHPLRVDPTGTTTQPISGTVTANAGTGNFAVVQATAANLNATVTANGNFNNASVSGTAASPPSSATYIGGSVTTSSPTYTTGQMNALSLTTAGALRIDGSAVTQPVSGTVTANAGTGTFTVAGTVTANQGTTPWVNNISQFGGSSVVTGTGASGAGIPRVTVSNDSNILATQSGTWTVAQGSANTLANAWPEKITDGTNGPVAVKPASTAAVAADPALVVAVSPNNTIATTRGPATDRQVNGTIAALNAAVTISAQGLGDLGVQIIGSWSATLAFEATIDGSDWYAVSAYPISTGSSGITSTTANGQWKVLAAGNAQVRVRASAYTSGTATVYFEGNEGASTTRAQQGSPTTLANAWPHSITDTTNGPVAVKAASTAPAATDAALVVVLSPNQQAVPVTTAPSSAVPGFATGNVTVSSVTITAVLETTYTEQSSNFTGSVVSSNANDASAGTGARTITITYYDQTGAGPYTETATLNGTTAVNLSNTNHCFIEKIVVATVGSGSSNAGTISLYTGAGGTGTLVGTIAVGDNRTFWCHHYVPAGKYCYVTDITGGTSGSKNASFWLRSLSIPTANQAEIQITDTLRLATAAPSTVRAYSTAIKVTGPARIQAYITSDGTSTATFFTSFTYYDQ